MNNTHSMYKIVQYIAFEGSTKREKSPVTERSRSARAEYTYLTIIFLQWYNSPHPIEL